MYVPYYMEHHYFQFNPFFGKVRISFIFTDEYYIYKGFYKKDMESIQMHTTFLLLINTSESIPYFFDIVTRISINMGVHVFPSSADFISNVYIHKNQITVFHMLILIYIAHQ